MAKSLELVFKTVSDKEVQYSLSDPKDGLTKANTDEYMAACIAKNVFSNKSGDLKTAVKAQIKEVTVTTLV